jgi:hypothetical protein
MTTNKSVWSYSFFLLAMMISGLLAMACVSPLGFDPDLKLKLDINANISGEVGIDSVNSAEIQIRNHTKSIDIYRIDILYIDNGATPPVNGMAARITGAPVAGSQESILLRPITADVNTRYQLKLWYRQSASCPAELNQSSHPAWEWGGGDPDKVFEILELPRGKYVVHVYRKDSGSIGIAVEDDTSNMTEMDDHNLDQDYVVNVKVSSTIDLSGADININLPSGGLSVNTSVSFSNEVTAQFNALLDAINASRPYPNGYGAVVVRNHTSKQLTDIEFVKGVKTVAMPLVRPEDQEWKILSRGAWDTTLKIDGNTIGPKNVLIDNQGKSFLHVYKNKSGGYSFIVSEKEWSGDLILSLGSGPESPDSSYSFTVNVNLGSGQVPPNKGVLYIHNMTPRVLDDPNPGKMRIVSQDLAPTQTFEFVVGAKATMGGLVDPSNYTISVGSITTSVFVSHMTPTHVYFYKTRSGDFGLADYWPPRDADQSSGIDIDLGDDQGVIVVKNRTNGLIIDYFAWRDREYEIQLTAGDDVSTVVEAGTGTIGFKVRGGNYAEYVTRTINPGQRLEITVMGGQLVDVTPPITVIPPPAAKPVATNQTVVFKHETGYTTPIEYLILYRDNGIKWDNAAQNTGYVWLNSGVYYLYSRERDGVAPDNGNIAKSLPNRPSNNIPSRGQWTAAPIPGLDKNVAGLDVNNPVEIYDAIANKTALLASNSISIGDLGSLGKYAVKVKGTQVSSNYGTPTGDRHAKLEIVDSVIIQFDPPLQKGGTYEFQIARGGNTTADPAVNWFVSWVGAHHNGSPTSTNTRYNAGYYGDCWFIMCPWFHDKQVLKFGAKGVEMRYWNYTYP